MRPFEYDLIKGLKISEQIAYKKKYFEEKTEIDTENQRRLLMREKMKSNDSNQMNKLIEKLNKEGTYPTVLVDESLK